MNFTMYPQFLRTLAARGVRETAEYTAGLGFSSVEILEGTAPGCPSVIPDRATAKTVRETLAEYGLSVACYSVGTMLYKNPAAVDSLKYQAEIAAELGCPYLHHTLVTWLKLPENAPTFSEALEPTARAAAEVANYAAPLGVTCLYEDQGVYANGVDGFGKFYRAVKDLSKNVGVCGDMGNTLFAGESPVPFFEAYVNEIRHVHVKDYLIKTGGQNPGMYWLSTEGGSWLRDTMIGHGDVDIASCMNILKKAGYTGAYAFEIEHPEPFEAGVKQGMDYLRRFV